MVKKRKKAKAKPKRKASSSPAKEDAQNPPQPSPKTPPPREPNPPPDPLREPLNTIWGLIYNHAATLPRATLPNLVKIAADILIMANSTSPRNEELLQDVPFQFDNDPHNVPFDFQALEWGGNRVHCFVFSRTLNPPILSHAAETILPVLAKYEKDFVDFRHMGKFPSGLIGHFGVVAGVSAEADPRNLKFEFGPEEGLHITPGLAIPEIMADEYRYRLEYLGTTTSEAVLAAKAALEGEEAPNWKPEAYSPLSHNCGTLTTYLVTRLGFTVPPSLTKQKEYFEINDSWIKQWIPPEARGLLFRLGSPSPSSKPTLFRKEHVGKSKSLVAKESALAFNPNAKITAYHDSITESKFDINFYKQLTLVMNALDNRNARSHVNRMCLAAKIPLIESASAEKLFQKLFSEDVKYLLSMENLWKKRKAPTPLDFNNLPDAVPGSSSASSVPNVLKDQRIWSMKECAEVFEKSVGVLKEKLRKEEEGKKGKDCVVSALIWDKDDKEAMDFVTACSNIRPFIFGIQQKSRFDTKSMAGNIIPAIPATNAIVAGLIVTMALKVMLKDYYKCNTIFVNPRPTAVKRDLFPLDQIVGPNPACYVCAEKPEITVKLNLEKATLRMFGERVLKSELAMIAPDVEIDDGSGTLLISSEEGETEDIADKLLKDFKIKDGSLLKCDDFLQEYEVRVTVMEMTEEEKEKSPSFYEVIGDRSKLGPKEQSHGAAAVPKANAPSTSAQTSSSALEEESKEKERVSTRGLAQSHAYSAEKLFQKLFSEDVKYLLSMENLWKKRKAPTPLDFNNLPDAVPGSSSASSVPNVLKDQRIWSMKECAEVFEKSVGVLKEKLRKEEEGKKGKDCVVSALIWDKDDKEAMDFVTACSNIRPFIFGIQQKSRFDTKSMAGNIIPAIPATNAIVAGLIVTMALKVMLKDYYKCNTIFVNPRPTAVKKDLFPLDQIVGPNPACYVCAEKPEITVKLNLEKATLRMFGERVLKSELAMIAPDVELDDGSGTLLISSEEGETEDIADKLLKDFKIRDGSLLKCDDFLQECEVRVTVMEMTEEEKKKSPLFYEVIGDRSKLGPKEEAKSAAAADANAPSTSAQTANTLEDDDDLMVLMEEEEVKTEETAAAAPGPGTERRFEEDAEEIALKKRKVSNSE